jgi:hypothetical protein
LANWCFIVGKLTILVEEHIVFKRTIDDLLDITLLTINVATLSLPIALTHLALQVDAVLIHPFPSAD